MFLGKRYIGQKRFGLEGAESAIPVLDAVLERAAADGHAGAVLGMAHRGRLNVLANIVGKSYDQIFKEFEGYVDPDSTQGSGDVKYHLGQSGKFVSRLGDELTVELAANPSHLEAVRPRRRRHGPRPAGPHRRARGVRRAARARARRRGLRRAGRGGRDAEPLHHQGLPRRRHGAPHHQQPARVHHATAGGALVRVLHRHRQDGPGADLPRERRRPRGVRARGPAGVRVPPGVPQGRRHRHGLLPAPRSQRGRRPELHPAAHVQAHRRSGARSARSTPRRW